MNSIIGTLHPADSDNQYLPKRIKSGALFFLSHYFSEMVASPSQPPEVDSQIGKSLCGNFEESICSQIQNEVRKHQLLKENRAELIAHLPKCSAYGNEDKVVLYPFDSGSFRLKVYGDSNIQKSLYFHVTDPTAGQGNETLSLPEGSAGIDTSHPDKVSAAEPIVVEKFNRIRAKVFGYSDDTESLMDFHYYAKSDPGNLSIIFRECLKVN